MFKHYQGVVLSSLLFLTACNDSKEENVIVPVTTNSLAQAAAAVIASHTLFDTVLTEHTNTIEEVAVEKGSASIACGTSVNAGSFLLTLKTETTYPKDGVLMNHNCQEGGETFNGKLDYSCLDNNCDTGNSVATVLSWTHPMIVSFEPVVTGVWTWKLNSSKQFEDEFKGEVTIKKANLTTKFAFGEGVKRVFVGKNTFDVQGKLDVSQGNSVNCVDGAVSYQSTQSLTMASGSQRLTGGVMTISNGLGETGVVSFNADGSLKVSKNGVETVVPKADFESYCGLKEAYGLSEKLGD
ncbi:MAG TPA: hypothetical protein PLV16_07875 [Agitococcus sp.]|nr:hypothetical protein [Agitococcus sp.]